MVVVVVEVELERRENDEEDGWFVERMWFFLIFLSEGFGVSPICRSIVRLWEARHLAVRLTVRPRPTSSELPSHHKLTFELRYISKLKDRDIRKKDGIFR